MATADGTNAMATGVHVMAIMGQALVLSGLVAFTLRLPARRDLATGALVFFALGSVALIVAAAARGLIAPATVRGIGAGDSDAALRMREFMRFTGIVNQAFTRIYLMLGGGALLMWGLAGLTERSVSRALMIYGTAVGMTMLLGGVTGRIPLDIHGFGAVVLAQGVWMGVLQCGSGEIQASPTDESSAARPSRQIHVHAVRCPMRSAGDRGTLRRKSPSCHGMVDGLRAGWRMLAAPRSRSAHGRRDAGGARLRLPAPTPAGVALVPVGAGPSPPAAHGLRRAVCPRVRPVAPGRRAGGGQVPGLRDPRARLRAHPL